MLKLPRLILNWIKKCDSRSEKKRDQSASPVSKHSTQKQGHSHSPPVDTSSGLESAHQPLMKKGNNSQPSSGPDRLATGPTSRPSSTAFQPDQEQIFTSACAYPRDTETAPYEQISDDDVDWSDTFSGSDDGQLSDSTEAPEQTESMSYRETVWSVRSYMGWHHIPTFETDYSESDKSNNPWKGKHTSGSRGGGVQGVRKGFNPKYKIIS